MFLKKNVRTYKGRTYTNYTLVEAVRTPAGPRQRSICSLGDLGPRPRREWLALAHRLQAALAGRHSDKFSWRSGKKVSALRG